MNQHIEDDQDMQSFGREIGSRLRGGECIELIGDVGAGKTTFMKGLGRGLGVDEDIQSPSFTISRVYEGRNNLRLEHYDFYRLHEAGIMSYELDESLSDPSTVVAVEWASTVGDVLPGERIIMKIEYVADSEARNVTLTVPENFQYLMEEA